MSNYHVISGSPDGNTYQVVFHIPIPDILNDVGVSYRTALSQMLQLTPTTYPPSIVKFITPTEQAQLDAGELYEYSEQFETNPGMTLIQKRDALDTRYNELVSIVQARLQNVLRYWGFSRDVP